MKTAPYGTWPSPLSAEDVAAASIRLGGLAVTPESVFWGERRPSESGRTAVVELHGEEKVDRLPEPWNVRSRAHEYGGGAFCAHGRTLFFSDFSDGRVWAQLPDCDPVPLTPPPEAETQHAFADLLFDGRHQRLVAVRESHLPGAEEGAAALVAIDVPEHLDGSIAPAPVRDLAQGADFYSSPTLDRDRRWLAWLTWSHPQMPWDGTTLWLAPLDEHGEPQSAVAIAGGQAESIFQPGFDAAGNLVFVSDRSGWWNLYRFTPQQLREALADDGSTTSPQAMAEMEAEFGRPQWVFGMTTWTESEPGRIHAAYTHGGLWHLGELRDSVFREIETPYSAIEEIHSDGAGALVILASCPERAPELARLRGEQLEVIHRGETLSLDPAAVSHGLAIRFPTKAGDAHAFFYAPKSTTHRGPEGQLPPLVTKSHGGPTAAADNGFDTTVQYWTTRGFAVVDVNYGGSTGFGREYRQRLEGQWGVVDVEDCVAAARYLAQEGHVDARKLAIRGGSAGGYTTLAALAFTDTFFAGASHYGVGDLEALARDTHKFESRYLDGLIGPYPEAIELYRERSPVHAADRISCPVIFFQGLDDKIVPPNQAREMVAALEERGIEAPLILFEGEGHGFRRAENITRVLEEEYDFYRRVLRLA